MEDRSLLKQIFNHRKLCVGYIVECIAVSSINKNAIHTVFELTTKHSFSFGKCVHSENADNNIMEKGVGYVQKTCV